MIIIMTVLENTLESQYFGNIEQDLATFIMSYILCISVTMTYSSIPLHFLRCLKLF